MSDPEDGEPADHKIPAIDLYAGITPRISAAGIVIGRTAPDVIQHMGKVYVRDHPHRIRMYSFDAVRLWVRNGCIVQICVRSPYQGKLSSGIGIGSSIADVEAAVGVVKEDDEDNLVVEAVPGWSFETEEWIGSSLHDNRERKITEICVFEPRLR